MSDYLVQSVDLQNYLLDQYKAFSVHFIWHGVM